MSPFKRKECGPSNFDASTSSRLIAFLRARNFLLAHLTSTKKLRWTDESISWDSDFFVISYRYGACGTAYDELRPTDDGCGDCRSFFFTIALRPCLSFLRAPSKDSDNGDL